MYTFLLLVVFTPDIDALASEDFDTREQAEAHLTYWGDLAYPLLQRNFTDLEKNRRARRIVGRTLPASYPPLSLLSGRPMLEWGSFECKYQTIGTRPGPEWSLVYTRPDPNAYLAKLIHHYGERARTQYIWKDWHTDRDGREATRRLCKDLLALGVPPSALRGFTGWLEAREMKASALLEKLGPPNMLAAD